ncbi:acaloleptin A [Leptinotarsa decemlineata]|uniref:acaloleptin A n=1 Tax=Leptinotarsa decemlineata TaxID=7539 RepID=UPI003D309D8D
MIEKLFLFFLVSLVTSSEIGDIREKRSLQPGAPNVNIGNKDQPWQFDPNVARDEHGNVVTDLKIKNHGENHDFHADWNKVVRGPSKAKPTWNVGGTIRWRRSLQPGAPNVNIGNKDQPWQFDPNVARDEHGNVVTDLKIKNHGENHDFHADWNKVVRGPSKAKPTWNVGGTIRWRRSLQPGAPNVNIGNKDQPWQFDPNVARDEHGNVVTDLKIKNHGENHDFHGDWNKVVRGPSKAKPTWNVGGTIRWRRSLQPEAPNVNIGDKDQPWQFDPNVARDEHGNVVKDLKIKNHGENQDLHGDWNRVVRLG